MSRPTPDPRGLTDGLPGYRFDHAAVAAHRMIDVLPLYLGALGGRFVTGGDNPEFGFRGAQFEYPGGKMEVLEPLPDSQFLDTFFEKRPHGGLHHVTYTVDDLPGAIGQLEERGFQVLGVPQVLDWWSEVFLSLSETSGALIQIAQHTDDIPHPGFDLHDVLRGQGNNGNGIPSPGYDHQSTSPNGKDE